MNGFPTHITLLDNVPDHLLSAYKSLHGTRFRLPVFVCSWKPYEGERLLCVGFQENFVYRNHLVISKRCLTYHISVTKKYNFAGIRSCGWREWSALLSG